MSFIDYALHHIGCVARLARGDERALADMDTSADGFWASFGAIPAALPALFFAWVVEARQLRAEGVFGSIAGMVARMAVLEVIFWVLPVIGLALAMKPLGFGHRFAPLIVARNWLSALLAYLLVAVPMLELATGGAGDAAALLSLLAMGIVIWLSVRVTRIALQSAVMVAFAFVAVETMLLLPLAVTFYGLVGLYPPV